MNPPLRDLSKQATNTVALALGSEEFVKGRGTFASHAFQGSVEISLVIEVSKRYLTTGHVILVKGRVIASTFLSFKLFFD